jgi:hypothetical protein
LDFAGRQVRRSQEEAADYRVEDCLVEAEDAIDTASAAEADREAAEDSGAADRRRLAERLIYRPA